jgi:YegS/Rv2252/BmrU family lipid kinase
VSDRRVCLIVNPSAGGGRGARRLPAVTDALRAHGVDPRTVSTTSLDHARELAREAAEREEVAVAVGGDGLIGAVAGALIGTGGVLGIVPAGRGNDLARVLDIPTTPAGAAGVVAGATPRPLDLAEVAGRVFCGVASCGFDSEANRIANETSWMRGNAVYLYAALRAIAAWQPARFDLEVDGEPATVVGWSVGACNSKAYGGGMYVAPDARLDDGLLDVASLSAISKRRFVTDFLPKVFRGAHAENPAFSVRRGREVRIAADRPFTVYADGDPVAELPVTVRSLPAAVPVLAP